MKMATREAYGAFLASYAKDNKEIVVLDADLSKSTKTAEFQKYAQSVSLIWVLLSKTY